MRIAIFLAIFCTILVCEVSGYSLQGRWNVKGQYLFSNNTSVSISFDKQLNDTNNRIQYTMNIFTCKLLRYKYIVVDNEIYYTFDSEVTQRYECKVNEIEFIRSMIEKTFYFMIIGTELSLYGPNNEIQMKLSRVIVGDVKSLSGEWVSVQVNGSPIRESISISDSELSLCGGKGVVGYSYNELSRPVIGFKVLKTGGCVQNEIYSTLSKVGYMRWKGSNLVYLYNGDYEQTMSMRRIGDRIIDNSIIVPTNNVTTNLSSSNNVTNGNKSNISSTNSSSNSNSGQSNVTQQNKNVSQTSTTTTTQNTQQASTTNNQQIIPVTSIVVIPLNTTTQSNIQPQTQSQTQQQSPNTFAKYSSPSDLPILSKNDLQGKWAIKDNTFDFTSNGYFFLILPDKIMLYGGCNVHFSTYTLNQNTLSAINLISTSKSCPELPQTIKTLIDQFKSWKYLAFKNNNTKPTLQILDSKFNTLNNLQKLA